MSEEAKIQEINCPTCMGVMKYDMDRGLLICPFCGYKKEMTFAGSDLSVTDHLSGAALFRYHGIEGTPITEDVLEEKMSEWGQKMVQASCKSCGGEIVFQEGSMTATCPYCNSTVLDITDTTQMPPTAVVLFKYKKEGIKEALGLPIFNNILCPKAFKNAINVDEFTSMYVPLWVLDVGVELDFYTDYGEEGPKTSIYKKAYNGIEVAASNVYKLLMDDQKEKYDIELHAEYTPEVVAGCVVQKYTVSLKEAFELAKEQVLEKAKQDLKLKLIRKYKVEVERTLKLEYRDARFVDCTYRQILVPVYFHSIPYEGKVYPQSVNGQNGTYIGDFPAKFRKAALYKMYV